MVDMKKFKSATGRILVLLGMASIIVAGCGGSNSGDRMIANENQTNLQRLCNMYTLFQSKNGWQGPADEAALKKFIRDQNPRVLSRMGIDAANVDAIFTSERDNEKFIVLWATAGGARDEAKPIVAEKTGVSGMRMIGFTLPVHREVDDAEYRKLFGK
jgi:hypothetical protein